MVSFFEMVGEYLSSLWAFLGGIIEYTIILTKTVIGTVEIPLLLSPYVPTVIWVSMSLIIALGVIKIILGRASI